MNETPPVRLGWEVHHTGLSTPDSPAVLTRLLSDGTVVACAGLAVDRFVIDTRRRGESDAGLESASPEVQRAWRAVAAAFAYLKPSREFWHVISGRSNRHDGAGALHVGWLAVGRGATSALANEHALSGLTDLLAVLSAHCDFFTLRTVRSAEALRDTVRFLDSGHASSLRKQRWEPPMQVEAVASAALQPRTPGALLPWPGDTAPWAPLMEAIAALPGDGGLAFRCLTGVNIPPESVSSAEADVLAISAARLRLLDRPVEEATPVQATLDALGNVAGERLRMLRGPCLVVDAVVLSQEPVPAGFSAIVAATLVSSPPASEIQPGAPYRDAPPVVLAPLTRATIWEPLDVAASPELLVSPREAVTLIRTAEPPQDERSPLPCSRARVLPLRAAPDGGTELGDGETSGGSRSVYLSDSVRLQHVYVVGQTGTGKSTLLLNMALSDIAAGHGLTLLDPHGTLVSAVLDRIPAHRRDDVVLVDPADLERHVGMNLLDLGTSDPAHYVARRDAIVDELFDTFEALYDLRIAGGPIFEQYFRVFSALVMGAQPPLDYVPMLPMLTEVMNDKALALALCERLGSSDPVTAATLTAILDARGEGEIRNAVPYIVSKLNRFYGPVSARRILCQTKGLDFADVLASRKILLVDLPPARLGRDTASLLARQVIARLGDEAMRRGASEDAPVHFVYADEFHYFATERFASLLAEARKFGLGLVLAHQYTSQLIQGQDRRVLDAVLGNVGTVVAFRVGAQDAQLLNDVMAPRASATDVSGLPDHAAVVRSVGALGNVPFTLRTRMPAPAHESGAAAIRERSRQRYGRPSAEVDAELGQQMEALRAVAPQKTKPASPHRSP